MKKIFFIIFLITFSIFVYKKLNNNWTLMICESSHITGGCAEDKYILTGYRSQRECMEKGILMKNTSGFECGLNCKDSSYGGRICDEICNEKGCTN